MNKKKLLLIFVIAITQQFFLMPQPPACAIKKINDLTQLISFTFLLEKKDFIYKDFIQFSVAHPDVFLSEWKAHKESIAYYDPLFKNTKHVFTGKVIFSITAAAEHYIQTPVYLYCTYYQKSEKKIQQCMLPLIFSAPEKQISSSNAIKTSLVLDDAHKKLLPPPSFFKKFRKLLYTGLSMPFNNPHPTDALLIFLIAFCTSIVGIISIKKSTKLPKGSLCTFYSMLGTVFITSTVFIIFKLIQVIIP